MTNENKNLFISIALGTLIIGLFSTLIVYFIFGEKAGYFFMIFLALPIGAISSLLLMILVKSITGNK